MKATPEPKDPAGAKTSTKRRRPAPALEPIEVPDDWLSAEERAAKKAGLPIGVDALPRPKGPAKIADREAMLEDARKLDAEGRIAERKRAAQEQAAALVVEVPRAPEPPAAPASSITLTCAADIKPEHIAWLWGGWLARGKVHVMAGAPGTGKTTVALSLAATLTACGHWPDGTRCHGGDVLIWSGEDAPGDTLVPRLIAAGAHLRGVHFVSVCTDARGPRPFDLATDVAVLSAHLASMSPAPALLIVDPIVSAVAGDSNQGSAVRRALQPLVELAQDRRCAILGISHFSKGTQGRDPTERVTGSLSFGAVARVVMATAKLPDHEGGGRILVRSKSNNGIDSGGFRYAIEYYAPGFIDSVPATRVVWGATMDGTARELLSLADTESDNEEQTEQQEAGDWLRELLSNGPMMRAEILKKAAVEGFSKATVKRAGDDVKITSERVGFGGGSRWSLPRESAPECDKTDPQESYTPPIRLIKTPFGSLSQGEPNGENVSRMVNVYDKAEGF